MIENEAWKQLASLLGHRIIQTVCKLMSVKLTNWKSLNPPYTLGFTWRPRVETTWLASANTEILAGVKYHPCTASLNMVVFSSGKVSFSFGQCEHSDICGSFSHLLEHEWSHLQVPSTCFCNKGVIFVRDSLSSTRCVSEKAHSMATCFHNLQCCVCCQHHLCLRGKEIQEEQKYVSC